MVKIHQFTFNLFGEHTMLCFKEAGECVIVDPGFYSEDEKKEFLEYISSHSLKPEAILLTHAHVDHIWGVKDAQDAFGIPVYMGKGDSVMLEHDIRVAGKFGLKAPDTSFSWTGVEDGDIINAAGMEFTAITTPGHSPGGVCWLEKKEQIMFSGDTLFAGTIGRTDLQYCNYDDLIRSIMEKLIWLDPAIEIYPGHGHPSTIGTERTCNPFLEPFNEKEELPTEFDPR